MNPADPIRLRLRQLLHEGGVSQTALCKRLEKATGEPWRIPRLSKLLNGHIALRVEDVVLMAQAAGISLVELFREPGREFVADLTPSELRLLAAARDNRKTLDTLLAVTDLAPKQKVKPNRRLARERTKLRLRENT